MLGLKSEREREGRGIRPGRFRVMTIIDLGGAPA
jgi:hypothetical protein